MNTDYLTFYISHQLQTCVRVYTKEKQFIKMVPDYKENGARLSDYPKLEQFLLGASGAQPLISSVNSQLVFSLVTSPDNLYLIGPVYLPNTLPIRHNLIDDFDYDRLFGDIYTLDLYDLLSGIALMHNLFYENIVYEQEIFNKNCIDDPAVEIKIHNTDLIFENRENEKKHNPYDQELRMLESIKEGDLKLLEIIQASEFAGNFGTLAKDADRNYRDISISVITLISRAAIAGGLNYEIAFSMCDSYVMKIEELKNLNDLRIIVEGAKTAFATMVRDLKEKKNIPGTQHKDKHPMVERCKDYIYAHLHGKITLHEAAAELQINPTYLSNLFRKYENLSFTDFVLMEKISLVKNLLVYSNYSYIEIASYLGFSSQSHLGKIFKDITGMTLREYRNAFGANDF